MTMLLKMDGQDCTSAALPPTCFPWLIGKPHILSTFWNNSDMKYPQIQNASKTFPHLFDTMKKQGWTVKEWHQADGPSVMWLSQVVGHPILRWWKKDDPSFRHINYWIWWSIGLHFAAATSATLSPTLLSSPKRFNAPKMGPRPSCYAWIKVIIN